jgi:hypothetical protein
MTDTGSTDVSNGLAEKVPELGLGSTRTQFCTRRSYSTAERIIPAAMPRPAIWT